MAQRPEEGLDTWTRNLIKATRFLIKIGVNGVGSRMELARRLGMTPNNLGNYLAPEQRGYPHVGISAGIPKNGTGHGHSQAGLHLKKLLRSSSSAETFERGIMVSAPPYSHAWTCERPPSFR